MPNKYNAKRVTVDGKKFDSKAESRRYAELVLLERAGAITRLVCHPRYIVWHGLNPDTMKREKIEYIPDFEYIEDGRTVAEDVKGGKATQTTVFHMKAKMFRCVYPEIELRIVDR